MLGFERAGEFQAIDLLNLGRWVGQSVSERTVVRENQQTLAVLVQSACTEKSVARVPFRKKIYDDEFGVRIFVRAGVAPRFVHREYQIFARACVHPLPVYPDDVHARIDAAA